MPQPQWNGAVVHVGVISFDVSFSGFLGVLCNEYKERESPAKRKCLESHKRKCPKNRLRSPILGCWAGFNNPEVPTYLAGASRFRKDLPPGRRVDEPDGFCVKACRGICARKRCTSAFCAPTLLPQTMCLPLYVGSPNTGWLMAQDDTNLVRPPRAELQAQQREVGNCSSTVYSVAGLAAPSTTAIFPVGFAPSESGVDQPEESLNRPQTIAWYSRRPSECELLLPASHA